MRRPSLDRAARALDPPRSGAIALNLLSYQCYQFSGSTGCAPRVQVFGQFQLRRRNGLHHFDRLLVIGCALGVGQLGALEVPVGRSGGRRRAQASGCNLLELLGGFEVLGTGLVQQRLGAGKLASFDRVVRLLFEGQNGGIIPRVKSVLDELIASPRQHILYVSAH